jgi:hypothetical protein
VKHTLHGWRPAPRAPGVLSITQSGVEDGHLFVGAHWRPRGGTKINEL